MIDILKLLELIDRPCYIQKDFITKVDEFFMNRKHERCQVITPK